MEGESLFQYFTTLENGIEVMVDWIDHVTSVHQTCEHMSSEFIHLETPPICSLHVGSSMTKLSKQYQFINYLNI